MSSLSSEQMRPYILSAKRREQNRLEILQKRRQQALEIAKIAAEILKKEFGAEKIILFGSLLNDNFHENSDIDLAVFGLSEKQYFKAVARLISLSEFEFDLVEFQYANPEIAKAISEGIIL